MAFTKRQANTTAGESARHVNYTATVKLQLLVLYMHW